MIAKQLMNDETAMPAFAAYLDAKKRNAKNQRLWDTTAKAEAARLAEAVTQAYSRSRVYTNYRLNFIAIKVDKPTRHDMVSHEAAAVETYAELQGYQRVVTKNAIIFRIRK